MNFANNKSKKGQTLVETALILPIIILIIMGIIDFGLIFNNYLIVSNVSREAARSAAVGQTDNSIQTQIASLTSFLDYNKVTYSIYPSQSLRQRGQEVSVTVRYNHTLITPIISSILPSPIQLKSSTVMRVE